MSLVVFGCRQLKATETMSLKGQKRTTFVLEIVPKRFKFFNTMTTTNFQVLFTSKVYKNPNRVYVYNKVTGEIAKVEILKGNVIRKLHGNQNLFAEEYVFDMTEELEELQRQEQRQMLLDELEEEWEDEV